MIDKISNCCGATPGEIDEECMRCSKCGEPCDYVTPCKNDTCDGDAVEGQEYCLDCLKKEASHA